MQPCVCAYAKIFHLNLEGGDSGFLFVHDYYVL